jgi:hypothetical protein
MANPAAVSDANGEWFEIYNNSENPIDINGLVLKDTGSNQHTVFTSVPLVILAGDYFVFGRNDNNNNNGGYQTDYRYNNFTLNNSSDAIILEFQNKVIASLIYSGSIFVTAGNSAQLTAYGFELTGAALTYGDGDVGTPGTAGNFTPASPVPLPAAGWLLAAAFSALIASKYRRD